MNNLEFRVPKNEDEFNEYDLFRWRLLRKPIGKTIESLKDEYEDKSFHLIGVIDNQIVACGRLHFIDDSKAQIRYMAVDEKYQRKVLVHRYFHCWKVMTKKNNADKVILNARDHAIKFYAAAKYTISKKYHGSDTGIPHTTMTKDL